MAQIAERGPRAQQGAGIAEQGTGIAAPPSGSDFDPSVRWVLHPGVSVRPEAFGALLYHFGTRRLSFLKDRRLLDIVTSLPDQPSVLAACAAAGIATGHQRAFIAVLARLAQSEMLIRAADPEGLSTTESAHPVNEESPS